MAAERVNLFVDKEDLVLDRNGQWMSNGQAVEHEGTIRAFFRNIHRENGAYLIRIGRDSKSFTVEDTAYFVTRVDHEASGGFTLTLSDGSTEKLDPATLEYSPGRLICRIKRRSGGDWKGEAEDARFLRSAYMDLLKDLKKDDEGYFLTVEGRRVHLGDE